MTINSDFKKRYFVEQCFPVCLGGRVGWRCHNDCARTRKRNAAEFAQARKETVDREDRKVEDYDLDEWLAWTWQDDVTERDEAHGFFCTLENGLHSYCGACGDVTPPGTFLCWAARLANDRLATGAYRDLGSTGGRADHRANRALVVRHWFHEFDLYWCDDVHRELHQDLHNPASLHSSAQKEQASA